MAYLDPVQRQISGPTASGPSATSGTQSISAKYGNLTGQALADAIVKKYADNPTEANLKTAAADLAAALKEGSITIDNAKQAIENSPLSNENKIKLADATSKELKRIGEDDLAKQMGDFAARLREDNQERRFLASLGGGADTFGAGRVI